MIYCPQQHDYNKCVHTNEYIDSVVDVMGRNI